MNEFLYPLISLFFLAVLAVGSFLVIFAIWFLFKFFKGSKENKATYISEEVDQPWSELKGETNSAIQDEDDESD